MRRKKLLTLGCAAGILACGACFLPPPHEPPPPLPPNLAAVHTIAIQVEDTTTENRLDPVPMSEATARNFNRLWADFRVRAKPFGAESKSDSVLRITVRRKTESCSLSGGKMFCSYEMIASFTVTAADGSVLQNKAEQRSQFGLWVDAGAAHGDWNSSPNRQRAAYALAMTAGFIFDTHSKLSSRNSP
jgi:hypothetical protein